MKRSSAKYVSQGALIAALYIILTEISAIFGLSGGVIQLRLSEALCVLPIYLPAAIPGLFIGCIISNLLTGCVIWDIILGSLATLIGAVFTRSLKKSKYLATLPPVIANTLIIPPVLKYVYGFGDAIWFIYVTVFIGEILSCTLLGASIIAFMNKRKKSL